MKEVAGKEDTPISGRKSCWQNNRVTASQAQAYRDKELGCQGSTKREGDKRGKAFTTSAAKNIVIPHKGTMVQLPSKYSHLTGDIALRQSCSVGPSPNRICCRISILMRINGIDIDSTCLEKMMASQVRKHATAGSFFFPLFLQILECIESLEKVFSCFVLLQMLSGRQRTHYFHIFSQIKNLLVLLSLQIHQDVAIHLK